MEIKRATAQDMECAISFILQNYDDTSREGLKDSPARILKAWNELLIADEPRIAIFDAKGYSEMICDKRISYYSFCEHHFLPFFGEVTIAYIPDKYIIGLSKLSRIVEYFSKRLNTQEYLTENIANYIQGKLNPAGVAVYINGRHLCKEMRGAKKNSIMNTMAFKGLFKDDLELRQRFLNSINN